MRALRALALFLIFFLAVSSTGPEPESLFFLAPRTQTHPRRTTSFLKEIALFLHQEDQRLYEKLSENLSSCNGKTSIELKCPYTRVMPLKINVYFKNQGDSSSYKLATENFKIKSCFMVQSRRRRICVEFGYPMDNHPVKTDLPPFLKLTRKNRHGKFIREYLEFLPDGSFRFEDEPLSADVGQAVKRTGHKIKINLPELAQILGARSRVLQYFYFQHSNGNPGDDEMDLENSDVERSL